MSVLALVFAWGPSLVQALLPEAQSNARPIGVSLASSKLQYVLGEPVALTVSVENLGVSPVEFRKVRVDRTEPEIVAYIAEEGRGYRQYKMGIFGSAKIPLKWETLQPGQSKHYRWSVLYAAPRPSRMAFDAPGKYSVKVVWPLNTRDFKFRQFDSNTIQLEVKQPQRTDAKVWEVLRAPEFLYFLQCGLVRPEHENVPRKTVDILRKMPKSAYDDALRYALKEHYSRRRMHMNRPREEADPEMRELRELLGIVMQPEGPFPDDRRLDVKITFHFPEWTPREQVFEVISVAGGVPLRVAPELARLQGKGAEVTMTLRKFMHYYEDPCMWVPEPDGGYRLVPTKPPERTTVPEPPKQEGR